MRIKLYLGLALIVIASIVATGCQDTTTPEPEPTQAPTTPINQVSLEESRQTALDFVTSSATYTFDGMPETLELDDTLILRCPSCWTFVFRFDSRHAGYGDRTDQMLAQVITPHEASITVIQSEITDAVMDGKWDMMFQMMIASEEESLKLAEEFLMNSPTFRFDGIEGSIKHTDTLEAFCPYCWGFVFEFECASAGYGDRTGQEVATVITAHEAIISVSQGQVDGGTIDSKWDMFAQQEITKPTIEIETAVHNSAEDN
jgi:hypothetical protein